MERIADSLPCVSERLGSAESHGFGSGLRKLLDLPVSGFSDPCDPESMGI